MTPELRRLVLSLFLAPVRGHALRPDEFRTRTGIEQPSEWALHELQEAIDRQDSDDAEIAFIVGSKFDRDHQWAPFYQGLLLADWHHLHEEAAHALGFLGDSDAVPALVHAVRHVPAYLRYDDGEPSPTRPSTPSARSPGLKPKQHSTISSGMKTLHSGPPCNASWIDGWPTRHQQLGSGSSRRSKTDRNHVAVASPRPRPRPQMQGATRGGTLGPDPDGSFRLRSTRGGLWRSGFRILHHRYSIVHRSPI